ncbi:hypothetical protein AYO44_08265 [Planctomycetaceae bacterium SCGC AG-212-F19]|nr:hypothetical protein AYO44_08265 [Planctomycetaceae bacterium SCGC AG-212-F19]
MDPITNTFVLVAPDCPVKAAVVPVPRGPISPVHVIQYELLTAKPYKFTLEDLIYQTHIRRAGLSSAEVKKRDKAIRAELFSKTHACMRASALPKRYGWGVHYDERGRLALFPIESAEYRRFAAGNVVGVQVVAAMRSKRASA